MLLLEAKNIKKSYGDRLILSLENLEIHSEDRIGLVGINGSGKTTLLNILAGYTEADVGVCKRYADFSFVRQFKADNDGIKLRDYMSGGEKTRIILSQVFSSGKPLLLADEPTTHLDINGIKELERQLLKYRGAFLIISHDRELLDRICNRIVEIENAMVTNYKGNYSSYLLNRNRQREQAEFEYQQYRQEKSRLEQSIKRRQAATASVRKTPKRMGNSEARLHKRESSEIQKKLSRSMNALQSRLDRLEPCEGPVKDKKVIFHCNPLDLPVAKVLVSCDNLSLKLGSSQLLKSCSFVIPKESRTALIGANGTGKTSLLRLLASRDPCFRISPGTRPGYLTQEFEDLDLSITVLETAMNSSIQPESTVRTVLARLLIKASDINKKVRLLSGGERVKLAIARLLVSDANLLILDEPNNYLDLNSTEALQELIIEYPGTVLFVSHDRQLIQKAATRVIAIEGCKLMTFEDGYRQFEEWTDKMKGQYSPGQFESEQLVLKMRCAEIAARLANPRKSDDLQLLKREYDYITRQILGK
ncbi:MAG TPA: ABC-F family ATP-binding cassette domain-containing protein [Syntrophomonadaceae bacterium]|nr:ABC-F family ATP-binding cassette domain-containing protein [Syntrophomonadaceae bacterium]